MITINNKYDSSELLFSLPVYEKQDIVNNTIENIFNFNPNCKIILHINKNFKSFDKSKSNYHNLYFNQTNFDYYPGSDLLIYHVSNFDYCINNNISFEYFIFCASNELYIKKNAVNYIKEYKNGLQLVQYDKNIDWHNFKKDLHENQIILNLFEEINNNILCGGQVEGQFFEKKIFIKIKDLYLKITNLNEHKIYFEAEEIIPQTIFNSLNIKNYGDCLTLQNYTNDIKFTPDYIKKLINNVIIPENNIKSQLFSPHINKNSNNIYSIKRVDRKFNKIRKYLSKQGIILNKDDFNFDIFYYSNNSSLIFNKNYEIIFNKKEIGFKEFNWFGFFLEKGYYNLEFEFKINKFINPFSECGIKFHYPYNYVISNFLNFNKDKFNKVSIPLINNVDQDIIFIFDKFYNNVQFEIKNIKFNHNYLYKNNSRKNIIIAIFKNNNQKSENFENFKYYFLDILSRIYNIYLIFILNTNFNNEKYILEHYNPNYIFKNNNINFESIILNIHEFIQNFSIESELIIIFNLDVIFLNFISNINLIFNKLNFLCYKNNNNIIDLSYDLCLIPNEYFQKLKNIKIDKIISILKNNYINFNLLIDDLYHENDILSYHKIYHNVNNNGFLLENLFFKHLIYYNNYCFLKKISNNYFYFYKKITHNYQDFMWFGYDFKFIEESNNFVDINLQFDMKINNEFNFNDNTGIKTHFPIKIYNNYFKNMELNKFINFDINLNIQKKNQLIIFNFDYYFNEIEIEIKNFKIIYNNNS